MQVGERQSGIAHVAAALEPSGFTELIDEHGADICVYGHLHGDDIRTALTGLQARTTYFLVSADAANFAPAELGIQVKEP